MFTFIVFALMGTVVAQKLPELPGCATSCLADFTSGESIGDCPRLDAKCICSSDSFLDGIACCLADACNQADQDQAVDYATQFCRTQGVQVPSAVVCSKGDQPSSTPDASPTESASSPTPTDNFSPGKPAIAAEAGLLGAAVAVLALV